MTPQTGGPPGGRAVRVQRFKSTQQLPGALLGQQQEPGQRHRRAEGLTAGDADDEWELPRFALLLSLVPALMLPFGMYLGYFPH